MRRLCFLRVAFLLAFMHSTVEFAFAEIPALEHACPAFHNGVFTLKGVRSMTFFFITAISAKQLFFHLSTVALGCYTLFASATEAFMTRSWTCMLTTGHHLIADFATAPARIIIGI
jgi:hypothetical protein